MKALNCWFAVLFVGASLVSSCEKDGLRDKQAGLQRYDIQGKVEKGPFISGSSISIQPMDSDMQTLGSVYNTIITDNLGSFMLGSKEFSTQYAEFIASGYFYNEVKGELSNGTLSLRALVDLNDEATVNVNILTHLKYARIKNLVLSGMKFSEANKQAQTELLDVFGLSNVVKNDVSSFSIISGTNESAALLAISSLLLMERSEAALTEYLSKLSADFGKNGVFSDEIEKQIADDKYKLAKFIDGIEYNVISRYKDLGLEINVKDLTHFIDWDNDGVAGNEVIKENQSVILDKTVLSVPNNGGSFTVKISSPIPVYIEPQVETTHNTTPGDGIIISAPFVSIYEGYDASYFSDKEIEVDCKIENCSIEINVSELRSRITKNKNISIYDYIGNVVANIEIIQDGKVVSEAPLLGEDGQNIVSAISSNMVNGFSQYNVIEQYYAYNKSLDKVKDYVNPRSVQISNSWSYLYATNNNLLQLKKYDESLLNVYGYYCDVLSALYYSNLIYGWGAVPYITDYSMLGDGIKRESASTIFADLKAKLAKAIENITEKKNEPLKDINGFFFASKDVARVLLANIHMYQGNYSEAKSLLQTVVDNGYYTLDASTNFMPSTSTDCASVTESTEVIYAFQYVAGGSRASVTIMEPGVIPYITLSDVFLSLAECWYKEGQTNNAEMYISKVMSAKNLTSTETDALLKIKDVREQILLYSGTYFAFLKRTGLANDICNIDDYQLLFPIPLNELYTNPKITQNPGY